MTAVAGGFFDAVEMVHPPDSVLAAGLLQANQQLVVAGVQCMHQLNFHIRAGKRPQSSPVALVATVLERLPLFDARVAEAQGPFLPGSIGGQNQLGFQPG